jgi:hypothetical protein
MKTYYVSNTEFKGLPKNTPFDWNEEQQLFIGKVDYIKDEENVSISTSVVVKCDEKTIEDLMGKGYFYATSGSVE